MMYYQHLLSLIFISAMCSNTLCTTLSNKMNTWILSERNTSAVCQPIAMMGRTLNGLQRATKDAIRTRCETFFLDVEEGSEDFFHDLRALEMHPEAWYATTNISKYKTSAWNAESAAWDRRRELQRQR